MPYYISSEQRAARFWRYCRYCRQPIARGHLLGAGDRVTSRNWWGLKEHDDDSEVILFCRQALDGHMDGALALHEAFDVPTSTSVDHLEAWLDA